MQETLRWAMKDALTAYEERPRDQWVFEWPAQVALVGTQVWWATEVNLAFGRLEEGCKDLDKLTQPASRTAPDNNITGRLLPSPALSLDPLLTLFLNRSASS